MWSCSRRFRSGSRPASSRSSWTYGTPQEEHEAANLAALAGLRHLQDLELVTAMLSPETQQAILPNQHCLTRLFLQSTKEPGSLMYLASLDSLVVLDVPSSQLTGNVADALFSMRQLQKVVAWSIEPSERWHDAVAQDCGIEELRIVGTGLEDSSLRNIPGLPQLRRFAVDREHGKEQGPAMCRTCGTGKYPHLMAVLQRQAGTLQAFSVAAVEGLSSQAAMPAALPCCKELRLLGMGVGEEALQLLSGVHMPLMEVLELGGPNQFMGPQAPLGWLAQLPALRKLRMVRFGGRVGMAVEELFEGRPEVDVSCE